MPAALAVGLEQLARGEVDTGAPERRRERGPVKSRPDGGPLIGRHAPPAFHVPDSLAGHTRNPGEPAPRGRNGRPSDSQGLAPQRAQVAIRGAAQGAAGDDLAYKVCGDHGAIIPPAAASAAGVRLAVKGSHRTGTLVRFGKPFHYPELLARVAAVLRRRIGRRRGPMRVGDLTVDPLTRRVQVGDREVHLANKEFALLRALAAEPHRVFTKDDLLRDVWGFRSQGRTRTLDSHASRLRRKLDPDGARYVCNCWGVPQRHLFEPIPVPMSGDHGQ